MVVKEGVAGAGGGGRDEAALTPAQREWSSPRHSDTVLSDML